MSAAMGFSFNREIGFDTGVGILHRHCVEINGQCGGGLCAGQFSLLKVQRPGAVLDITTAPSRAVFLFELDDGRLMDMACA